MAYYKKKQAPVNKKWYPQSVTIGKPVTTKEIAQKLADLSSLSTGDVKSVLDLLGGVLGDFMNSGRTVKLDGIGTFYYTADAQGNGVDSPDKVSAKQIKGTRVRFIPELFRNSSSGVTTRSMVNTNIFWEELPDAASASDAGDGDDDGESPDPVG